MVALNDMVKQFRLTGEEWYAEKAWIVYDVIYKKYSTWVKDYGDDMVQSGCMGLVKCKDTKESDTYIWSTVDGYIKSWIIRVRNNINNQTEANICYIVYEVYKKMSDSSIDDIFREVIRRCRVKGIMTNEEYIYRVMIKALHMGESYENLKECGNWDLEDTESKVKENDVEMRDMVARIMEKVRDRYGDIIGNMYEEWLTGQVQDNKVTYQELADKYGFSKQYVHKRLQTVNNFIQKNINI